MINPGSITEKRRENRLSYALLEIHDNFFQVSLKASFAGKDAPGRRQKRIARVSEHWGNRSKSQKPPQIWVFRIIPLTNFEKTSERVVVKNPLNQRTSVRLNRGLFTRLALHLCNRPGQLCQQSEASFTGRGKLTFFRDA